MSVLDSKKTPEVKPVQSKSIFSVKKEDSIWDVIDVLEDHVSSGCYGCGCGCYRRVPIRR